MSTSALVYYKHYRVDLGGFMYRLVDDKIVVLEETTYDLY